MDFTELLRSLALTCIDGFRRNRLPVFLSVIALLVTGALALTSDYDERPRYRKMILPKIEKAENQFFDIMYEAEKESDQKWRIRYFLEGHRRAAAALRVVREERPLTERGRKAQRELARYYELVDEELAIIRTEMSFNESYDYLAEWKRQNAKLLTIRGRWLAWVRPDR